MHCPKMKLIQCKAGDDKKKGRLLQNSLWAALLPEISPRYKQDLDKTLRGLLQIATIT